MNTSTEAATRPHKVLVGPLVPTAFAVGLGVAVDRYFEVGETLTWGLIALGAVALVVVGGWRRGLAWDALLLVAFVALGGGWHHSRWSDLAGDDLARRVDETPRPVWVRGVLREVHGLRPGLGPGDPGSTLGLLEITGFRDGSRWEAATGRAQLFVTGDRTDLAAGEPVQAAGTLGRIDGPLNPGEFDFRDHLRAQGVRLRFSVDDPTAVWHDDQAHLQHHNVASSVVAKT